MLTYTSDLDCGFENLAHGTENQPAGIWRGVDYSSVIEGDSDRSETEETEESKIAEARRACVFQRVPVQLVGVKGLSISHNTAQCYLSADSLLVLTLISGDSVQF